jgi:hypothetical protein
MNKKPASRAFLGVCLLLALFLLTRTISPTAGGFLFAIALAIFGGLSKGFRSEKKTFTVKEGKGT